MSHARMRHRAVAAGVLAAVVMTASACSDPSGTSALPTAAGGATTPSAAPTSASPAPSGTAAQDAAAAKAALAAYRAAFADWAAVSAIPNKADYQNPQLADHLTGEALSTVTGGVYIETNVKGGVAHGQPELLDPTVGAMTPVGNPTQVTITDCVSSQNWLLYTTDGRLYDDDPGGRGKTQAVVTDINGTWKVSQLVIQTDGTC